MYYEIISHILHRYFLGFLKFFKVKIAFFLNQICHILVKFHKIVWNLESTQLLRRS